jgi:GNAT superfamily N-acetyltransferase
MAHWLEIEQHKGRPDPEPDWLRYQALEQKGVLLILVACVGRELVGYSVSAVVPDLHYASRTTCSNDGIFLQSEFRRHRVGMALIRATEAEAEKAGAARVTFHANLGSGFQDLLQRLGYFGEAVVYGRALHG